MADHGDTLRLVTRDVAFDVATAARVVAVEAHLGTLWPGLEVRHVGATAVSGLCTKGDLDVQVRVDAASFDDVVAAFDAAGLVRNPGGYASLTGCSFDLIDDVDSNAVGVGVHVVVRDSPSDEQWHFTRLLRHDARLVTRLDALKRGYDGGDMATYRAAKSAFFEGLRAEPRFFAARALPAFPILVPLVAQWGDMDAFAHVNNVVYLRWFESARMALLAAIGFASADGVGPILHSQSCRYRRPLYAPDDIVAAARVVDVGDDRFEVELALYSAAAGAVAATGSAIMVSFDYAKNTKAPLPSSVRAALEALGR
jgi:acyl-CoA thioester hydrolase